MRVTISHARRSQGTELSLDCTQEGARRRSLAQMDLLLGLPDVEGGGSSAAGSVLEGGAYAERQLLQQVCDRRLGCKRLCASSIINAILAA